jgi:PhoPQ-activated pathogenicity-related protein
MQAVRSTTAWSKAGFLLLGCLLTCVLSTPLDDYINRPESVYSWKDTGRKFPLKGGATAHMLNVTSLTWLSESEAYNPNFVGSGSNVWWHQVAVAVPTKIKITNTSFVLLTGGCNKLGNNPGGVDADEEYLELAGLIAELTGSIMAVVYQIPNCPIIYPTDPSKKERREDAMIAWAWKEFAIATKAGDRNAARWVPRLPMAKAAFQSMRAIEEYTKGANLGVDIEGWVVSGASKRGWTTWMVGAATCTFQGCPNIIGIVPLVPIVPDLNQIIHRQYQSLGGFTFAFVDYKEAGILEVVDDPSFRSIEAITDPGNAVYADRLARLPKYVVVSSDDEFMQLDWTPLWYDSMASKGETHLLIIPNTEHSLGTGIPELLTALPSVYVSMSLQQPREERPYFSYSINNTTGELSVTVPAKFVPSKVVLHHGETTGKRRRDFRWIRIGGTNETEAVSGLQVQKLI